ncbi:MAG: M56 family metallopeptidase [Chitinophagaceae bacterium]
METIFLYPVKVFICSAIFCLYYWIALRNKRFHYYNRFYLLFAFFTSLILPVMQLNWFYIPVENYGAIHWLQSVTVSANHVQQGFLEKYMNAETITATLFLLISIILVIGFLLRIAKIFSFRKNFPVQKIGDVDFINTTIPQAPFSFLNMLFWRKDLSLDSQAGRQIFKHELSHINEKHSLDKLFVQSILCFYLYNPFFYVMQKELSLVHEFIADEKSVGEEGTAALAEMLLEAKFIPNIFLPAQPFFYSPIKRRILMLTTSKKPRYSYVRRLLVLPLLAVTVILFAFKMQDNNPGKQGSSTLLSNVLLLQDTTPYYGIYDSKKIYAVKLMPQQQQVEITLEDGSKKSMTVEEAKKFNIQLPPPPPPAKKGQPEITSVEISNDAFSDKKRTQSSTGNISITADTIYLNSDKSAVKNATIRLESKVGDAPLYVVNGEIISPDKVESISSSSINSINVLKGDAAIKKYGDKGKNGVIEMQTKNSASSPAAETVDNSKDIHLDDVQLSKVNKNDDAKSEEYDKVFLEAQTAAKFPGGPDSWIKYLQRNLNTGILVTAHAPIGKYTVIVSFLVGKDGKISEVKADNDPGYGAAAEAVRVIQRGPNWTPAIQNGKNVEFRQKQAVSFQISK